MSKSVALTEKITGAILLCASVLLYPPYYFGFHLTGAVKLTLLFGFALLDSICGVISLWLEMRRGEKISLRRIAGTLMCPACILLYEVGGVPNACYGLSLAGMSAPIVRGAKNGGKHGHSRWVIIPLCLLFVIGSLIAAVSLVIGIDSVLPMVYLAPPMLLLAIWTMSASDRSELRAAAFLMPSASVLYMISYILGISSFDVGGFTIAKLTLVWHNAAFGIFCAIFAVKLVKTIAKRRKIWYNDGKPEANLQNNDKSTVSEEKNMANEKIKGCGFHHIALTASNFEKSKEFYIALGFKPIVGWGEGTGEALMFDIGDGGILELFASGSPEIPEVGKWQHFALACDDPDAAYELALKAGATPHVQPKTVPLDSRPDKMTLHIAFVKGPDGEQIEFFKKL